MDEGDPLKTAVVRIFSGLQASLFYYFSFFCVIAVHDTEEVTNNNYNTRQNRNITMPSARGFAALFEPVWTNKHCVAFRINLSLFVFDFSTKAVTTLHGKCREKN